ncbi:MAG TPA: cytochrome D1 domain-containing protein [Vicinamibacterales bacterium]|nr:cytochrome D1 domain-containing protein [Vicinamibacterales bacterium]
MKRFPVIVIIVLAWLVVAGHAQSGRLLVLNKEDATFVIVNPDSGAIAGTVPVGQGPHELVASTDGRFAFASNYGSGPAPGHTISMIDIAAQKEIRRIEVAPLSRPHGLAFANGKLYFTAEANKKIARYDPATDRIDWQFETGQNATHMLLPSRDLRTIFTSNISSDSVSAIQQNADGGWTQTVIPVGTGPEGIDLSPDGREVWSAHSRDGGVSVIDVASKKVTQTINAGTKRSNRIKLTPDGKFALVSDVDTGELVVIDVTARKPARRIAVGKAPEGILIQPDGSRAFVAVNGDNHVAVVDLKTWTVARTLQTGTGPDGMAWVK